jgi:hypothetical protein
VTTQLPGILQMGCSNRTPSLAEGIEERQWPRSVTGCFRCLGQLFRLPQRCNKCLPSVGIGRSSSSRSRPKRANLLPRSCEGHARSLPVSRPTRLLRAEQVWVRVGVVVGAVLTGGGQLRTPGARQPVRLPGESCFRRAGLDACRTPVRHTGGWSRTGRTPRQHGTEHPLTRRPGAPSASRNDCWPVDRLVARRDESPHSVGPTLYAARVSLRDVGDETSRVGGELRGIDVILDGPSGGVEVSRYVQALTDTVWLLDNIDRLPPARRLVCTGQSRTRAPTACSAPR